MRKGSFKSAFVLLALLFVATSAFADDEQKAQHDYSRIAVFAQPSISFLSFEERSYFQNAIDTIYADFRTQALTEEESLSVAKQNFQKVNFCFPVTAGIQFQPWQDQFISAGVGFIYDNESVVLSDRKNKAHNYSYTIQGVPMFLEYRIAIPTNLITLSNGGLFSLAVRWYWTLPGTEIYTTWGKLEAENKPFGAGFGVSLGYLIASWHNFNVYGDIGFSSIKVESKKTFADIVPDGPKEKAKWDIGGLQLQIRASFGVWNKPKPKKGDDDDDDDGEDRDGGAAPAKSVNKPASADSTATADTPATKIETAPESKPAQETGTATKIETAPAESKPQKKAE